MECGATLEWSRRVADFVGAVLLYYQIPLTRFEPANEQNPVSNTRTTAMADTVRDIVAGAMGGAAQVLIGKYSKRI